MRKYRYSELHSEKSFQVTPLGQYLGLWEISEAFNEDQVFYDTVSVECRFRDS